jgi:hypothetical protein
MINEIMQVGYAVASSGINFNLLYLLFFALIALVGYYLAIRFNWLKPVDIRSRRSLSTEITEEIPRYITIDKELWLIQQSDKIKEYAGGWSRKLILTSEEQVKTDFVVTKNQIDIDKTGDELWNGRAIVFIYNKDGVEKDSEKDRVIEQQQLKIASLTEELKNASAGIDVQMRKRIKEQALARSAGTSLGYPSSDRQMPDERDI